MMRNLGIHHLGKAPWGSRIFFFYETQQDLIQATVNHFAAGLCENELCLWLLSADVSQQAALEGLSVIPDVEKHLQNGRLRLTRAAHQRWPEGGANPEVKADALHSALSDALQSGCAGMRVSGDASLFSCARWIAYQAEPDNLLVGREMLLLCTYSLLASSAVELLDVVRGRHISLVRRNGRSVLLDTLEPARDKQSDIANVRYTELLDPVAGRYLLTERERSVLALLLQGASSKSVAFILGISPRTVEFHRSNIMRKCAVRSIGELLCKVLAEV